MFDGGSTNNIVNISKTVSMGGSSPDFINDFDGSTTVNVLNGADVTGSIVLASNSDTLNWTGGILRDSVVLGTGNDTALVSSAAHTASGYTTVNGGDDNDTLKYSVDLGGSSVTFTNGIFFNNYFLNFENLEKQGPDTLVLHSDGDDTLNTLSISEGTLVLVKGWTFVGVYDTPPFSIDGTAIDVKSGTTLQIGDGSTSTTG